LGSLAVGTLRQLPLWPVTVGIVVGWGLSLVPFELGAPTALTVACFMLGGTIYGPFVALSVTLMQAKSPPQHLAAMLASRSAALLTASPLGTAIGGPLTAVLGPRTTLGGSGLATVALGASRACCFLLGTGTNQRVILERRRSMCIPRSGRGAVDMAKGSSSDGWLWRSGLSFRARPIRRKGNRDPLRSSES
jgi:hypothetical protein